ncbi:hypothetical protein ZWY2020_019636 [Hordeum vulgare]|nr:hypothetical protein ZWY2020_019636 [Hordeum vulgare]
MTDMRMRPDTSTGYPGRTYRFYTGDTVFAFGDGLSYTKMSHSLVSAPPSYVSMRLAEDHPCRAEECVGEAAGDHCDDLAFDVKPRDLSVVDELGGRKVALGGHTLHVGDLKHTVELRV